MSYAYCNKHKVSWNGATRAYCLECNEEREMMPSRYEPGDEPDECLCATHGRPKPCPYCRWDRQLDRYDERRKERDEDII